MLEMIRLNKQSSTFITPIRALILLLICALQLVACEEPSPKKLEEGGGGESTVDYTVAGESIAGESLAGESMAGEAVAGEAVAGESMAGESVAGESVAGESVAGEAVAGESVAGEAVAGEAVAGESLAGESLAGESVAGEPIAGESMAGESSAGGDLPTEPIEGCVGPSVMSEITESRANTLEQSCVTCVGAAPPNFILRDLNPGSCGVGQYYGLEEFSGEVTLVVLLRSSCGYCQAQLSKLEQMRFELLAEGHILWISIINEVNTEANLEAFTTRSMSAILQDLLDVNAWGAMSDRIMLEQADGTMIETRIGGDKDDMYIYGTDGTLARFLDDDNRDFSLNLSTDDGYRNVKNAILEVMGVSTTPIP